jgi:acetylornithine deacetylase/succinyl-diaminopimelate desuccinylase-like protein
MRKVLATALWVAACLRADTLPPPAEQDLAKSIYKEFIEIRSGYTTGATTPVAEAAAARLRTAGFSDADIFIGGPVPKKANLVVRYRGTGKARPLLLLAHTDVVEAKREDWSTDPFQFLERDGYFYGRGTGDDKAQAAVWIANLIRYKREGFTPDRDIIVALTADEEGGGPYNGVDWLLKNHRELINAEYCLNEGGWGEMHGGAARFERRAGKRKVRHQLSAGSQKQRRAQLHAGARQCDLSFGRCARTAVSLWFPSENQ